MRLGVDYPRQLVRLGRYHERPVGRVEVVQRNDGEYPVHGRSDRAPALVVGVGGAALVARRTQVGDGSGQMCGAAERGLHRPDQRRMFGNRGESRLCHPVAADGVLGRFRIGKRRRIGAALHLLPDDAAEVSGFLGGQDVAHNQIAFLVEVGDLLLAQGWGERRCTHSAKSPFRWRSQRTHAHRAKRLQGVRILPRIVGWEPACGQHRVSGHQERARAAGRCSRCRPQRPSTVAVLGRAHRHRLSGRTAWLERGWTPEQSAQRARRQRTASSAGGGFGVKPRRRVRRVGSGTARPGCRARAGRCPAAGNSRRWRRSTRRAGGGNAPSASGSVR